MNKKIHTIKRQGSALLAAAVLASSLSAPLPALASDIDAHWANKALTHFVEEGFLNGDGSGNYAPNDSMTRAQYAAIINRMMNFTEEADLSANTDVDANAWYRADMAKAMAAGYMKGTSPTTMSPNDTITREQAFTMVYRLLNLEAGDASLLDGYTDGASVSSYAREAMAAMIKAGFVQGDDTGALSPSASLTRAQGVTVLYRADLGGGSDDDNGGGTTPGDNGGTTPGGNGGNSSGGSGGTTTPGGSGGTTPGDTVTQASFVDSSQTKAVDLGYAQYVTVAFKDGYNKDNTTISVDGTDVTSALTPVTDDGSVMKVELATWNPGKLTATSGGKSQSVTLGSGSAQKAIVAPSDDDTNYILSNGAVYVWDYHLTNYDAQGNIRVTPAKTTFDLTGKSSGTDIAFYAPDAIVKDDDAADNLYKVSGNVEVMFNYETADDATRAWVDGITDVDLVAYDEGNKTLNSDLQWKLDKAVQHGNHTVAAISVPLGQSNFYSNGRYQLRVTSNGSAKLFPIHVVNEKVPSLQLSDASAQSGVDTHFKVSDMTYGITMPVYRVELTDPNGNTETLTKINDYYLIGDTFILYNDTTDHLATTGKYTLKIYADGFQAFAKEFYATGSSTASNIVQYANTSSVDIVSHATSSGGGGASSGSGSEGGSNTMNANLVFNMDLLANARLLVKLGLANDEATAIANRWDEMIPTYIYEKGGNKVFTTQGYFDAVNTARAQGTYLSADAYMDSEGAETTKNRPYAVKQVLEDNLLGDTTAFSATADKAAADLVLVNSKGESIGEVKQGEHAIFKTDSDYLKAITKVYLDGTITALGADDYTINGDTLTLNKNLKVGTHSLMIEAGGYQTLKLTFTQGKDYEKVSLKSDGATLGSDVSVGCETEHDSCDFLANLTSATLTAPDGQTRTVRPEGQESAGYGYSVSDSTLTLGGKLFLENWSNQTGTYTLSLSATGYDDQKVNIEIGEASTAMAAPSFNGVNYTAKGIINDAYYRVSFTTTDSSALEAYLKAIESVTINGSECTKKTTSFWGDTNSFKISDNDTYGGASFVDFTADCFDNKTDAKVVIKAEDYSDLTFNVSGQNKN